MVRYPNNPFSEAQLGRDQALAYLARIKLPASTIDQHPPLELLADVFLAQVSQIPKDTSPLHVSAASWTGCSDQDIVLGSSLKDGMPCGVLAHELIIGQNRGAFCFSIDAVFATLLRTLGCRVSQLVARCYKNLGADPLTHPDGYKWGTYTHQLLVADWPTSKGDRYLVDGAWGPWACNVPLKLGDETDVPGLN